jgi:hypothetical protein
VPDIEQCVRGKEPASSQLNALWARIEELYAKELRLEAELAAEQKSHRITQELLTDYINECILMRKEARKKNGRW